jgi:Thaumatin family/F5/8 type C domain
MDRAPSPPSLPSASRRNTFTRVLLVSALALCVPALPRTADATTFTVRNNCSYTVYPGIFPASTFQNGGWTLAPGASSTFTVPGGSVGRLWGRTGCDGSSPARCTTGQCGGTGLQCAGTTGQPNTSLFEWNINASGTDWYDVSYVDAVDNPVGVAVSNASCVSPSSCSVNVLNECPADLRSGAVCLSPCTRYNTDQFCCRGPFGTPDTCDVSDWAPTAQTYVDNVHEFCPQQYSYAYDEVPGDALHTCPTGANYTITFCPSGSAPPPPSSNLALGRPATASSVEAPVFAPGMATDGNPGTRWSSAFSDPQSITVDLGSVRSISRVMLRWEAAHARDYQIQTSTNGTSWTTIFTTTTGNGGDDNLTVSGSGRFVRMVGTRRATPWGYSLWELEVYGPP